ncbi:STAS domain-containing protein [Amycolatopsis mongoliensis]|uniref:STAS domain-containing protein n=1 Tax=Amycolatopsis mongoliensis TaxID=715475 RepID=A0A9Y2K2S8_9PSEU|nr:STAS domain-containing protein [Amycolatopsis sp. 4-36]WIY07504.1 STAS domain-containing protein [Amycolatopsis sp. 4-36]
MWPGEQESRRLTVARSRGNPQVVVLDLVGELDDGTVLLLAREVALVLDRESAPETVVVDLTAVRSVSASGLRALHAAHAHATGKGIGFRLVVRENSRPASVLDATKLRAVLDVYPSRAAALAAGDRGRFVREMRALWT